LLILLKKHLKFLNAASNMVAIQRAGCFVSCFFPLIDLRGLRTPLFFETK
jgi:hypothetical protein